MHLTTLRLRGFRNHLNSFFEFGDGTNVLLGENGQGKTNVIEAISYLCLTRSFYAGSDALVLNFESELFEVDGVLASDHGPAFHVRVAFGGARREKQYSINRQVIEPLSSVVGKFPVVICSPEHAPITTAGPQERRRFVDFVVSQSSAIYFRELLEYRRALKQRNRILLDAKLNRRDPGPLLDPWDEQLVRLGASLMHRRAQFIETFREFIRAAYHELVGPEEEPGMRYAPNVPWSPGDSEDTLREALQASLAAGRMEERRVGTSLVGPHRDEIALTINGLDLRDYASQGQHKTFLIALKIGEFFYLRERCRETPVMLLDDIFSELDEPRAGHLLTLVGGLSQTFITSTAPHLFERRGDQGDKIRMFSIQHGTVAEPV